jgi:hypothetical protein
MLMHIEPPCNIKSDVSRNFIRSNIMMKRQVEVDHDDSHYVLLIEDIAFGNNDDDLLNLESPRV